MRYLISTVLVVVAACAAGEKAGKDLQETSRDITNGVGLRPSSAPPATPTDAGARPDVVERAL